MIVLFPTFQCVVMINTAEDEGLLSKGLAREVTNRVQKLRKLGKLLETDKAVVYCAVTPEDSPLAQALKEHHKGIEQATGTPLMLGTVVPNGETVLAESVDSIKNAEIQVNGLPNRNLFFI
jgi:hypothetical protein